MAVRSKLDNLLERLRKDPKADEEDLECLLSGFRSIVRRLATVPHDIQESVLDIVEAVRKPNLDQLSIGTKLDALELLNYLPQCVGDFRRRTLMSTRAENNWQLLWKSCLESRERLNLFTVARLLNICLDVLPSSESSNVRVREFVKISTSETQLISLLSKALEEDEIYVQFQLKLFTVGELISLLSKITQLLSTSVLSQQCYSYISEYLHNVSASASNLLEERTFDGSRFSNDVYLDALHLALSLDVSRSVVITRKVDVLIISL